MRSQGTIATPQLNPEQLSKISWWIIYPHSPLRRIWDILVIIGIVYNVYFIPVDIAIGKLLLKLFLYPHLLAKTTGTGRDILDTGIIICFWLDIVLNFLTGYVDSNRRLLMEATKIRMHYAKTWLIPDLIANTLFESLIKLSGVELGDNAFLFRLLRIIRMLRLGTLVKFFENLRDMNIWRILLLFLLFFVVTHWVGCFYYLSSGSTQYSDNV